MYDCRIWDCRQKQLAENNGQTDTTDCAFSLANSLLICEKLSYSFHNICRRPSPSGADLGRV